MLSALRRSSCAPVLRLLLGGRDDEPKQSARRNYRCSFFPLCRASVPGALDAGGKPQPDGLVWGRGEEYVGSVAFFFAAGGLAVSKNKCETEDEVFDARMGAQEIFAGQHVTGALRAWDGRGGFYECSTLPPRGWQ
ncbi:hypothetical protein BU26DRAFT_128104 [Trematosphaeria pertusa]|uniref:Uncharacterized protein n=1 Tax=Trematosphaeria pertusa TaxID=390896 RepID=A0A6A6HYV1_9PLEO|nr:uncharacterized protein BU26DRAFT_128104 [Trematosphaeria pertusa]KAF2242530.1 hypothetical protein BU26DRAFT_128104 [Trematosphaeria pertusa]